MMRQNNVRKVSKWISCPTTSLVIVLAPVEAHENKLWSHSSTRPIQVVERQITDSFQAIVVEAGDLSGFRVTAKNVHFVLPAEGARADRISFVIPLKTIEYTVLTCVIYNDCRFPSIQTIQYQNRSIRLATETADSVYARCILVTLIFNKALVNVNALLVFVE